MYGILHERPKFMVHVGKYTSPIDSMGKESQTQKVHLDQPNCVLLVGSGVLYMKHSLFGLGLPGQ